MCTNGSCYQSDCPHCGPTISSRRLARAAARYPYQPVPQRSPWLTRVIARTPRLIAELIQRRAPRVLQPADPKVVARVRKMLPDRHELAVTETRGIIGTMEQ